MCCTSLFQAIRGSGGSAELLSRPLARRKIRQCVTSETLPRRDRIAVADTDARRVGDIKND